MSEPITLGVLLRVCDRPITTKIILGEIKRWATLSPAKLKVRAVVLADRPSDSVYYICQEALDRRVIAAYDESPKPLLDADGEHLTEAQNWQLDTLERICEPDWVYLSDDDRWPDPYLTYECLIRTLKDPKVDAYFFRSLFFHTNTDTFTTTRQHHTALLWRHRLGERLSTLRDIQVPDNLLDAAIMSGRTADFPAPLLDYGTFTHADCQAHVDRFRVIGKDDPYTRSALLPPILRRYPQDYDNRRTHFLDRMKEALNGPHLPPSPSDNR